MKVHHLDCGSMCPLGGYLLSLRGVRAVCHCLLIETRDGLVLVDTGFGRHDVARPWSRLGLMRGVLRPRLRFEDTAAEQIRRLGYREADVQHVIPTHLDLDHAGGLPDFPAAHVHVLQSEFDVAMRASSFRLRSRYRDCHWGHGPKWVLHPDQAGSTWRDFPGARTLPGLPPEVLLVPLPGHSRGHCGVALETASGSELHVGDAYYDRRELTPGRRPPGIRLLQRSVHQDVRQARATQERLRELAERESKLTLYSSHDLTEFERVTAG